MVVNNVSRADDDEVDEATVVAPDDTAVERLCNVQWAVVDDTKADKAMSQGGR